MTTILQGIVNLAPIAAVDTSSSTSGLSMFKITFPEEAGQPSPIIESGNSFIQFEYLIYESEASVPVDPTSSYGHGFLPIEDSVGLGNDNAGGYRISVPCDNIDYDPSQNLQIQVRLYVGNNEGIQITNWSNPTSFNVPPPKPTNPVALLYRGDYAIDSNYPDDDELYVIIDNNESYTQGAVLFIVSYSYVDDSGNTQWVVTSPLQWAVNGNTGKIILSTIELGDDVDLESNLYVAVNAVHNFEVDSGDTYYSVSEISETVAATSSALDPPVLDPIAIPGGYSIYGDGTQLVTLNWTAPDSSVIPVFAVDSYTLLISVGGVTIDTISDIANNVNTYNYPIPTSYINPPTTTTTTLVFTIEALISSGGTTTSNTESVNTFTFSSVPTNLLVNWALQTDTNVGDFSVSFKNPSSVGFGTPQNFVVNLLNSSNSIVSTQNVTYEEGSEQYEALFNNITTTPTGFVQIYLVTQDTNIGDDGLFASLNGAVAETTYTLSALPIYVSSSYTESAFSSVWLSSIILVNTCNIIGVPTEGTVDAFSFNTIPGSYSNYTVARTTNDTGLWQYTFTFQPTFFGSSIMPVRIIINVANLSGISFENLTR